MRQFLIVISFISCLLSFNEVQAQVVSTPMKAGRTAEGIVYFLPKLSVSIFSSRRKPIFQVNMPSMLRSIWA